MLPVNKTAPAPLKQFLGTAILVNSWQLQFTFRSYGALVNVGLVYFLLTFRPLWGSLCIFQCGIFSSIDISRSLVVVNKSIYQALKGRHFGQRDTKYLPWVYQGGNLYVPYLY